MFGMKTEEGKSICGILGAIQNIMFIAQEIESKDKINVA